MFVASDIARKISDSFGDKATSQNIHNPAQIQQIIDMPEEIELLDAKDVANFIGFLIRHICTDGRNADQIAFALSGRLSIWPYYGTETVISDGIAEELTPAQRVTVSDYCLFRICDPAVHYDEKVNLANALRSRWGKYWYSITS